MPETIYHATLETSHFSWDGYGWTEEEASAALERAWNHHRGQHPADGVAPWSDVAEDINVHPVRLGAGYRDRTEIAAPTTGGTRGGVAKLLAAVAAGTLSPSSVKWPAVYADYRAQLVEIKSAVGGECADDAPLCKTRHPHAETYCAYCIAHNALTA